MRADLDLFKTPFFIVKKLQRNIFRETASFFTGRVLDIGCGVQPYKKYLKNSYYIGMDEARDLSPVPDLCAKAGMIPFRDGVFDLVLCTEVLEHTIDPMHCLSQIKNILKKGGLLYLTVPQSWPLHYSPQDYWRFTRYGIEDIVLKTGFSINGIRRIGGPFTLVAQEVIDILWHIIKRSTFFLGSKNSERVASILCAPISAICYACGVLAGDRIDGRYAIGWAVVAVKR